MPLPPPDIARKPMHTRSIRVQGFAREDGLWDIEAELIDVKAYDFARADGTNMPAGQPVHHLHLRITIDESYEIQAAQAVYDAAPYGAHCTAIEADYAGLVGMNLLKGFRQQVKTRFGRVAGCTHMTELSLVLPTAAVQSMAGRRRARAISTGQRPFQLDGCHALDVRGAVVREHYPKWYEPARIDAGKAEVSLNEAPAAGAARTESRRGCEAGSDDSFLSHTT